MLNKLLTKKLSFHKCMGFEQESSSAAEKEALPGATSGQDGEPDKQLRAHGECMWGLSDAWPPAATAALTTPFSAYFRSKTWSSLRSKRKSLMG